MDGGLTVLMTVYNGGPFLRTAIDSILKQTYGDFQFLIVDDASTDDTREIVRSYDDSRIRLLCLPHNVGQTAALNVGLRNASTRWIARMDADDYSAPSRFEEQMRALDEDSSLDCVGSYSWIFSDDPQDVERIVTTPIGFREIKRATLSELALIHGCIVVSREALLDVGGYDERYRYCADVDLFDRLLAKYRANNVPKPLVGTREHSGNNSRNPRVLDENAAILSNRLANYTNSAEEAETVRANLSWVYLLRARRSVGDGAFQKILPDVWRALRAAPKKFPWYGFKVFAIYNLPVRRRATLKKFILWASAGLRRPGGNS